MARYSNQYKEDPRHRTVVVASRRLKRGGINGSEIAALTADGRRPNGVFSAHLASKQELAIVVRQELRL